MSNNIVGALAFVGGLLIGGGAVYLTGQQDGAAGTGPANAAGSIESMGGVVSDTGLAMVAVDGTTLYFSDFQALAVSLGVQEHMVQDPLTLNMIAEPLTDAWLVMRESQRAGLLDSDAARAEQQIVNYSLLYNLYMEDLAARVASKDKVDAVLTSDKYADQAVAQRKARHVLLETEQEALAVIKALDDGQKFEDLARAKSTGPSAADGGDLGWFSDQMVVAPFAEAAFAMEIGTYTKQPVKTEFGYHVILVEDERKDFETIRPQVENDLVMTAYRETTERLRAQADIFKFMTTPEAPEAAAEDMPEAPLTAPEQPAPEQSGAEQSATE